MDVQVQRVDVVKNFTVELKNDQGTTEIIIQKVPKDILGAIFKELSRDTKTRLGIDYGIEITELKNGKLRSAGIRNGFIILTANDRRIGSQADLEAVVESVMKKDPGERGLYIRGINPNNRRIEFHAINLNDEE